MSRTGKAHYNQDKRENIPSTVYDIFLRDMKSVALLTLEEETLLAKQMHDNQYEQVLITPATIKPAEDFVQQIAQYKPPIQRKLRKYQHIESLEQRVAFLQDLYSKNSLTEQYIALVGAYMCIDAEREYPAPVWNPVWVKLQKKQANLKASAEGKNRKISATPYVIAFSDASRAKFESNPEILAELRTAYLIVAEQCLDAYHKMMKANLRLVVKIASKYRESKGTTVDDIISAGFIGLCQAVQKFDYTKGYKFSTYASHWIRQSIERHISQENTHTSFRIPVYKIESLKLIKEIQRDMERRCKRTVSDEKVIREVMKKYRVKEKDIRDALMLQQLTNAQSLDDNITKEEGNVQLGTIVTYAHMEDPFRNFDPMQIPLTHEMHTTSLDIQKKLDEIIATTLTIQQEVIIRMRFGMYQPKQYSLEEIGNIMHLTRERIRQIEKKALTKLTRKTNFFRLMEEYRHRKTEEKA